MKKQKLTQWSGFTNCPDLWYKLELYKTNNALWVIYHLDYAIFVPNSFSTKLKTPITVEDDISQTRSWKESPLIFIIDAEGRCHDWVKYKDNIHVFDSTFYDHSRFNTYLWWFCEVVEVETRIHMLSNLNSMNTKRSKLFDVLLGRPRYHRDFVYKTIHEKHLTDSVFLSYMSHTKWIIGNDSDIDIADSTTKVIYDKAHNTDVNISCLLPWKIYNDTFYTLVTETSGSRIFLTEKTAKPILASRLFIIIGACGILAKLKILGFKTFDCVIDESYDNIEDDITRWEAAMEQVRYLCNQPPHRIISKICHIVSHNKKLILTFKHKNMHDQLKNIN